MNMSKSRRLLTLAATGIVAVAPLAAPAVASADTSWRDWGAQGQYWFPAAPPPPPGPGFHPGDWYHPEWGAGWNNGYPAPDWVPPQGWGPPNDWTNPTGWEPPPGWIYPPWWCSGPVRDAWHLRCR